MCLTRKSRFLGRPLAAAEGWLAASDPDRRGRDSPVSVSIGGCVRPSLITVAATAPGGDGMLADSITRWEATARPENNRNYDTSKSRTTDGCVTANSPRRECRVHFAYLKVGRASLNGLSIISVAGIYISMTHSAHARRSRGAGGGAYADCDRFTTRILMGFGWNGQM